MIKIFLFCPKKSIFLIENYKTNSMRKRRADAKYSLNVWLRDHIFYISIKIHPYIPINCIRLVC